MKDSSNNQRKTDALESLAQTMRQFLVLANSEQWERDKTYQFDYDMHSNPNAMDWAKAFCKTFPDCGADVDLMVGWFSSAMMAMHDHVKQID